MTVGQAYVYVRATERKSARACARTDSMNSVIGQLDLQNKREIQREKEKRK